MLIKIYYTVHYDNGLCLDSFSYFAVNKDCILADKMKEYIDYRVTHCDDCEMYEFKSYEIVTTSFWFLND